jgi:TRAP-type mannitol/chloroaromatic compound transport system permease large subunit
VAFVTRCNEFLKSACPDVWTIRRQWKPREVVHRSNFGACRRAPSPLSEVIWGTLPFVLLTMLAVALLCFFPGISTWLPDLVMGPDGGR